jgi:hypothetical protein
MLHIDAINLAWVALLWYLSLELVHCEALLSEEGAPIP